MRISGALGCSVTVVPANSHPRHSMLHTLVMTKLFTHCHIIVEIELLISGTRAFDNMPASLLVEVNVSQSVEVMLPLLH